MEVPDSKLYLTCLPSSGLSVIAATGKNADKISTPGAFMSGLIISHKIKFNPREEKETTMGATGSFMASLFNMLALACFVELR